MMIFKHAICISLFIIVLFTSINLSQSLLPATIRHSKLLLSRNKIAMSTLEDSTKLDQKEDDNQSHNFLSALKHEFKDDQIIIETVNSLPGTVKFSPNITKMIEQTLLNTINTSFLHHNKHAKVYLVHDVIKLLCLIQRGAVVELIDTNTDTVHTDPSLDLPINEVTYTAHGETIDDTDLRVNYWLYEEPVSPEADSEVRTVITITNTLELLTDPANPSFIYCYGFAELIKAMKYNKFINNKSEDIMYGSYSDGYNWTFVRVKRITRIEGDLFIFHILDHTISLLEADLPIALSASASECIRVIYLTLHPHVRSLSGALISDRLLGVEDERIVSANKRTRHALHKLLTHKCLSSIGNGGNNKHQHRGRGRPKRQVSSE